MLLILSSAARSKIIKKNTVTNNYFGISVSPLRNTIGPRRSLKGHRGETRSVVGFLCQSSSVTFSPPHLFAAGFLSLLANGGGIIAADDPGTAYALPALGHVGA
jgi:parallel beta-helix repeat protein